MRGARQGGGGVLWGSPGAWAGRGGRACRRGVSLLDQGTPFRTQASLARTPPNRGGRALPVPPRPAPPPRRCHGNRQGAVRPRQRPPRARGRGAPGRSSRPRPVAWQVHPRPGSAPTPGCGARGAGSRRPAPAAEPMGARTARRAGRAGRPRRRRRRGDGRGPRARADRVHRRPWPPSAPSATRPCTLVSARPGQRPAAPLSLGRRPRRPRSPVRPAAALGCAAPVGSAARPVRGRPGLELSRGGGGHARTQKRPVGWVGGAGARGPGMRPELGERPGPGRVAVSGGAERSARGSGGARARSAALALRLSGTFPAHPASPTRAHMTHDPAGVAPEDPHPPSGLSPRWAGQIRARSGLGPRGGGLGLFPRVSQPASWVRVPQDFPTGGAGHERVPVSAPRPPPHQNGPGQERAEGRGLARSHPAPPLPPACEEGRPARRTDGQEGGDRQGPLPWSLWSSGQGQGGDRPSEGSRLASLLTARGRRRRRPAVVCCSQRDGPDLAWRASGLAGSRGASCRRLPGALSPPSTPARAPAGGAGRETAPGSSCPPCCQLCPQLPSRWVDSPVDEAEKCAASLGGRAPSRKQRRSDPLAAVLAGGTGGRGGAGSCPPPSRLRPSTPSSVADT